jgi:excisionase family DNA binding protein
MSNRVRTNAGRLENHLELAISIVEAARRAGIGRSSLYEAISRKELPVRKCGRRTLILVDDLKVWIAQLPTVNPGEEA